MRRMAARGTVTLLSVLALLALAGCGEQRGAAAAMTTPRALAVAGGRTVAVSLTEYRLTPARPQVRRAGTITFDATNDGDVSHALVVEGPVGVVRTATLRPRERATLRVSLPPGSYKWYCPLADHERRGMAGTVSVAQ